MTSPAGGDAAAPAGDAQQGEAAETNGSGPDLSQFVERLDSMSSTQEEMRQLLSQQFSQADEEPEAETPGLDPAALEQYTYGDEDAATQLANVFEAQLAREREAMRAEMRKQVDAVNERVTERERMEQMADLVHEFPDMGKPEVAQEIVNQARSLAEANSHPELGAEPWFWRLTYAAQQSFQRDAEDGAETPAAAHLEGGAGTAGGQREAPNDILQALDDGAQGGRSVLPFP